MTSLNFTVRGEGNPVLLIHGFPMNQHIWDNFAPSLARDFKVYTIDLPGFGNSVLAEGRFTIENIARQVLSWLEETGIGKCVLSGHSLGGYVALAMARLQPELFSGLVLFHSTAYPDSEEKKESRNKVIDFVDRNGVQAFTSNFAHTIFADQKHSSISFVREICIQSSAEAVKGYTEAMRDRPDQTNVIRLLKYPILFIAGEKDAGIPAETVQQQASMNSLAEILVLPNVGHMGMFENEVATLDAITAFSSACFTT